MTEPKYPGLPFLTRDMLSFEHGTRFALNIRASSLQAQTIRIRGATREGPLIFDIVVGSAATETDQDFSVPDFPIFLAAFSNTTAGNVNNCYIRVVLQVNGQDYMPLMQGNISFDAGLAWPWGVDLTPLQKIGAIASVQGTNPAANTEISETFVARRWIKLKSVRATLVTDANAANRAVALEIFDDAGTPIATIPAAAVQVANTTVIYTWGEGLNNQNDATALKQSMALPADLWIPPQGGIQTVTVNRQATDNWGAPQMLQQIQFGGLD